MRLPPRHPPANDRSLPVITIAPIPGSLSNASIAVHSSSMRALLIALRAWAGENGTTDGGVSDGKCRERNHRSRPLTPPRGVGRRILVLCSVAAGRPALAPVPRGVHHPVPSAPLQCHVPLRALGPTHARVTSDDSVDQKVPRVTAAGDCPCASACRRRRRCRAPRRSSALFGQKRPQPPASTS